MANTQTFIGDGATTVFSFTFPFFGINDIHASINNIEILATNFSVAPNITPDDADIQYTGGTITFATAPANGTTVKVWRRVELARHIDYQPTLQPLSYELNQDFNQCMEIFKEQHETLTNVISLATIPNVSNLLDELVAIRGQLNDCLTADDLTTLNSTVDGHTESINTLNGYDYVINSQSPTAENDYTWYREYKTGWIEQGGIYQKASFSLGSGSTIEVSGITFPKTLAESPKIVYVSDDMTFFNLHVIERTTTGIKIKISNQLPVSNTQSACNIFWSVQGTVAE